MLPVFLLPLYNLSLLCLDPLSYGKASKTREDVQGVHEGTTTGLSMLLSVCPMPRCPAACSTVTLHVPDCVVTVCARWSCSYKIWLLLHLTGLSVLLSFCPSEGCRRQYHSVFVQSLLAPPPFLRVLSLVYLSFIFFPLSFLSSSPTFSRSPRLSCQLFIRCVNNCLPTVVIAPPCQPEVWSKWQCAQFSLAYIVQFLVSLVPVAGEKNLLFHCSCVLSVGLIPQPIDIFAHHLNFSVSTPRHLAFIIRGGRHHWFCWKTRWRAWWEESGGDVSQGMRQLIRFSISQSSGGGGLHFTVRKRRCISLCSL